MTAPQRPVAIASVKTERGNSRRTSRRPGHAVRRAPLPGWLEAGTSIRWLGANRWGLSRQRGRLHGRMRRAATRSENTRSGPGGQPCSTRAMPENHGAVEAGSSGEERRCQTAMPAAMTITTRARSARRPAFCPSPPPTHAWRGRPLQTAQDRACRRERRDNDDRRPVSNKTPRDRSKEGDGGIDRRRRGSNANTDESRVDSCERKARAAQGRAKLSVRSCDQPRSTGRCSCGPQLAGAIAESAETNRNVGKRRRGAAAHRQRTRAPRVLTAEQRCSAQRAQALRCPPETSRFGTCDQPFLGSARTVKHEFHRRQRLGLGHAVASRPPSSCRSSRRFVKNPGVEPSPERQGEV